MATVPAVYTFVWEQNLLMCFSMENYRFILSYVLIQLHNKEFNTM